MVLGALPTQGTDQRSGETTMITAMLMCASLTAVDGHTVHCDEQLMRLLGGGAPFRISLPIASWSQGSYRPWS